MRANLGGVPIASEVNKSVLLPPRSTQTRWPLLSSGLSAATAGTPEVVVREVTTAQAGGIVAFPVVLYPPRDTVAVATLQAC